MQGNRLGVSRLRLLQIAEIDAGMKLLTGVFEESSSAATRCLLESGTQSSARLLPCVLGGAKSGEPRPIFHVGRQKHARQEPRATTATRKNVTRPPCRRQRSWRRRSESGASGYIRDVRTRMSFGCAGMSENPPHPRSHERGYEEEDTRSAYGMSLTVPVFTSMDQGLGSGRCSFPPPISTGIQR